MKTKNILLLVALFASFALGGCKKEEPFDTQSADDYPIILMPFETETGKIFAKTVNPNPYVDSVLVTPSAYTTVNWYLDGELVFTGTKIAQTFPTGTYDLLIEAVTTAGRRTSRSGTLTVEPAATDPYVSARVLAPGVDMTVEGKNLDKVVKVVLSKDLYGKNVLCTIEPIDKEAGKMTVKLPQLENGTYYLGLIDDTDTRFGSGTIQVQNASMALAGFASFSAGEAWTITGANLQDVMSVTVGEVLVTDLTTTATSVTLTAPSLEEGEYTLSMLNKDGSKVLFYTSSGLLTEVKTRASAAGEKTIWEGSCVINWGDANVHVNKATMATVPAGATVFVYYNVPDAEYHSLRVVVAPDWSADIVSQVDGMQDKPSPFSFVYDDAAKAKAEADDKDGILVTGFGLEITQITYK